jgi:mannose-6-phosphate isomerase-like protein (cupin superfamily)
MLPLDMDAGTYSPETHTRRVPDLHFVQNQAEASRLMEKGNMQSFKVEEFGLFVVCSDKIKVNVPPKPHLDHEGVQISEALYYIDEHILENGDAIYLSYLPPGKQTSEAHRHWYGMFEHYNAIAGDADMTLGYGKTRVIRFDDYIRVPFGMGHRMKARGRGILSALYTENPDKRPQGTLHIREGAKVAV